MTDLGWFGLPYGVDDVDRAQAAPVSRDTVRCCIQGCSRILVRAHRAPRNNAACFCQEHQIRVSPSRTRPTYVFRDASRNFIVDRGLLQVAKKTESWRLGNETSEDALSWNMFVGLMRLSLLRDAVYILTGVTFHAQPRLYLWGNEIMEWKVRPWALLHKIRDQLERGFGIQTEPDVALHVPGELLVLIEAEFGSPNSTLDKKSYDTVEQFLEVYSRPEDGPEPLEREWIAAQPATVILEQLCRLAVFGTWMRKAEEKVVVVNLLREAELASSQPRFVSHLAPGSPVQFEARAWEQLIPLAGGADNDTLERYLKNKSYCLLPAFTAPP